MLPATIKDNSVRALTVRAVAEIALYSGVINLLMLVSPIYMLQVYDRVLPAASLDTLLYLSLMGVGALVFLGLIEVVRSYYSQRVAARFEARFAASALKAALSGPRASAGDVQPLRDMAIVRGFIASRGLATLFDLPFSPLFILLLWFVHPALFALTLVGAGVMVLVVVLNQLANKDLSAAAAERSAAANLSAQALARSAETLRAMGMIQNVTEAWGRVVGEAAILSDRAADRNAIFSAASRSVRMILQMAILGVGAYLVLRDEMTAGMIFASSIISGRALQPLDQLVAGWRQVGDAQRAWHRLSETLRRQELEANNSISLPKPVGRIAVENLVYAPAGTKPGAEPLLKRLSFEVAPGECVAIIGPSRAGKSTLTRLLVGAIQPSSGTVRIDGAEIGAWKSDQLGGAMGYLGQDIQLLPGTIAQNISRFSEPASDEEIVDAAIRAQVHELILQHKSGYQTQLDASTSVLSGGERQRIGLARAFFGDPRILVLDEPNSSLDAEGEAALARALKVAREHGTTIILVTHRLSVAATCDKVMVLRAGGIEAYGPAAQVLQRLTASVEPVRIPRVRATGSVPIEGGAS
ncbi:type I secretion system permease/ATPase [Ensifer oleiphilus]|nr:type I secretion system permease/ATPase [Ensifer oleiphilus]